MTTAQISETASTVDDLVAAAEQRWDAVVQRCIGQLERRGSPLVAGPPAREFVQGELHLVLRDLAALVHDRTHAEVPTGLDTETVKVAGHLVRGGVQPAEAALAAGCLFEAAIAVVFDDVDATVGSREPAVRFCAVLHAAISSRLVRGYQAWHVVSRDELRLRLLELAGSVGVAFVTDTDGSMPVGSNGDSSGSDDGWALTGREREVLELVAEGLTNRRIASLLCVREGTVRTHLYRAYRKLHATGRVDAANKATSRALIPPQRR